jgi:hypothetical protein
MSGLLGNLLVLSALLASTAASSDEQDTIEQCKRIKQKINHYTELRRSGGSSSIMEEWKRERDRYKDQYSDLNCTRWRNKLR